VASSSRARITLFWITYLCGVTPTDLWNDRVK
jgi:hypothetical protein